MDRKFLACLVVFILLMSLFTSIAGALSPVGKFSTMWGKIKAGDESYGISDPKLAPSYPPVSWLDEIQFNQKILNEADIQAKANVWGGECKVWVQNIVKKATGRTIPTTYTDLGTYYQTQWNYGSDVRVVWQACYICLTRFPNLLPGQIIQLRWREGSPYYGGPHTAIIKAVSPTGMEWYDSNWKLDHIVRSHPVSLNLWNQNIVAWTVYQVK